jgi:hypothetical protein
MRVCGFESRWGRYLTRRSQVLSDPRSVKCRQSAVDSQALRASGSSPRLPRERGGRSASSSRSSSVPSTMTRGPSRAVDREWDLAPLLRRGENPPGQVDPEEPVRALAGERRLVQPPVPLVRPDLRQGLTDGGEVTGERSKANLWAGGRHCVARSSRPW